MHISLSSPKHGDRLHISGSQQFLKTRSLEYILHYNKMHGKLHLQSV